MWWRYGGVDTPASGTASVSAVTDTSASLTYEVQVNDDTNIGFRVNDPDGVSVINAPITEDISNTIEVGPLTPETEYSVILRSDLNTEDVVLTTFVTEATEVVETPATGAATLNEESTVAPTADTNATVSVDYNITYNDDSSVKLLVTDGFDANYYSEVLTEESGNWTFEDTAGVLSGVTTDVYLTSTLNTSDVVIGSITVPAEVVARTLRVGSDMTIAQLKEYAKDNDISLTGARNKTDILNAINSVE